MGVATETLTKIDTAIVGFAADKSQAVIAVIEPAVIAGMSILLMFQGYKHMMGQVDQPFSQFVDTTVKMVAIVTVALSAGTYNDYIISTFQDSPAALAAALSGVAGDATLTGTIGASLDKAFFDSFDIAKSFWADAGWNNVGGYIIGFLVLLAGFVITVYTGYLVALSKIGSGLLLAFGPVFIAGLLFDATKGFFSSYISALVNTGLVSALAVGANALILSMFWNAASEAQAAGSAITSANAWAMLFTGGIGFLILLQVPNLAASLSGGTSMNPFSLGRMVVSAAAKGLDRATGGRARKNQREANNRHDVNKRVERLVARETPRWPKGGNISKTGTND
jgi:type IV secretion system protein VirB6